MIDTAKLRIATAKADEYLARQAALAAAASGGDVKQAPAESPQSGDAKQRNAQRRSA